MSYRDDYPQAYKIYPLLKMKCQSVLPDEGFEPEEHLGRMWKCLPKPEPKGRWGHRLLATCHHCGLYYPFGRLNQHEPACKQRDNG